MTTIYMVRHGETDWNRIKRIQGRTDIPLNNNGIMQAEKLQPYLEKMDWDLIITSPLSRAKKTAEIINQHLQLPLITMDVFQERGYGDVEGMTHTERETAFPPDVIIPNQESREDLVKRVTGGLEQVHQQYKGKRILIVSHGGVINGILLDLSGGRIGSGITKLDNTSITHLENIDNYWKIVDYNHTEHLISDF